MTTQSTVDTTPPDGRDLLRTVQGVLATIVADVSGPPDEAFAPHQRLFDHALGSLQVLQVHAHLEEALGIEIDMAALFDCPTIGDMVTLLATSGGGAR